MDRRGFFSFFWKKIISHSGNPCGRILDIFIQDGKLAGFAVIRGFRTYFIGSEFVENDSGEAVVLSIEPVYLLIGKSVFDSEGRRLGRLNRLVRNDRSNEFAAIVVKRKFYTPGMTIPASHIAVSKHNIVLKETLESILRGGIA